MLQRAFIYLVTLLVTRLITTSNGAHILGLFPIPAKSHFGCNHAILKSLHAAGHQITMVTPFPPEEKVENFTYVVPSRTGFSFVGQSTVDEWTDMSLSYLMIWGSQMSLEYCDIVMELPLIQDALKSSEKLYDAIMAEYLLDFECYLPIAKKLGIPVIATVTLHSLKWADRAIGLPNNPAVIPMDLDSTSVEMNLLQRVKNLWDDLHMEYYIQTLTRKGTEKFCQKHFPPELLDKKDVSLIFYNNHPSILPRPYVPNAIDVGGIHVPPARPLPKDIQKFIDEAPHGVILFTFGSVVRSSSLPAEIKSAFLTAFASIPQRVIWKYEEPLENLPANIMISNWVPQRDILEHKNVIAFMSHCGQSGVYEAVMTGKPVVAIPIFADQRPNAAIIEYRGVGVYLNFRTATKETVLAALNAIVNDTRYYERMQELSRVFKDRPMTPQETVVYWTEYVIRHNGAPHLRAIGTDMPLYQYLMLDIIALALIIASSIIALVCLTVRKIYSSIANKSKFAVHTKKDNTYSLTLTTLLVATSNTAHILGLFPILAKSHFGCNHAILKSLHAAGHQVTMVTPFPPDNKVENITYITPPKSEISFVGQFTIEESRDMSFSYIMNWANSFSIKYCEDVINLPLIQETLQSSEKLYDALMAEHMSDVQCYLPIAEKLGIPFISTMTLRSMNSADRAIGVPNNPAVIPSVLYGSSVEMNLLERMENLWNRLVMDYYTVVRRAQTDKFYHKYFAPELHYKKDVSLIFYNNHPSLLPRPYVPNAIDVGGIHIPPARPLPKDIQKFIDEAPHGVILFTFGSVVKSSSLPAKKRSAFLTTFASIPQRVIWKYEEPFENLPDNIMISSWLPQRDILEHKNVIAFISHCGQSGVYEAVTTGTPVIAIPVFADQRPNAALLQYRGVGIHLDFETATKETVLAALNDIVNDTRYYQRMQELSRVFKDRPMSPQESVVYWTKYVIRHKGAPHLRAIGTDMPLYRYLMLDIIALGLILASLMTAFIYKTVSKIYTYYERMQELSRVFKDRPMTLQETVVYWTEYVIRHNGAPHLRAISSLPI